MYIYIYIYISLTAAKAVFAATIRSASVFAHMREYH